MVTLIEKPDSTTGEHPADHHDQRQQPPEYPGATGAEPTSQEFHDTPPPFSESGSSTISGSPPPAASAAFAPLSRPTNYLTIERENSWIKGTYSIDPTLPALPGAIKSQGRDGKYLNLKMLCQGGIMSAIVDIVRGQNSNTKGPARLETISRHGNMDITLHDRLENRFHLRAVVQHSMATIRIPPTFVGMITTSSQHSMLRFNYEVKQNLVTVSERQSEGRYFIGDLAAHGYDEETPNMDHLDIDADFSTVTVRFSGNPGSNEGTGIFGGFFSRFFDHFS